MIASVLAGLVLLAMPVLDAHARAVGLLLRSLSASDDPASDGLAALGRREIAEVEEDGIPGVGRMRWYVPSSPAAPPPLVLVHGVHPRGMDERRLRSFARAMAEAGVLVATPHVESLTHFRIDRRAIVAIGDAARVAAQRAGRARAGVLGISFSGGLALIAAGDPNLGEAIGQVVALGAHHDVARIARWYVGQDVQGPNGESPPVAPHPYGAGVLLENHLDRFLAARDVEPGRAVMEAHLLGRPSRAKRRLARLSRPGQRVLSHILERGDDEEVGAMLLEAVEHDGERVRSISPAGQLDAIDVPVFLVHGTGDPVVPSTETLWLAEEVPASVLQAAMVTPLFRHAELEGEPTLWEQLSLVHVIADILRGGEALRRVGPPRLPEPGAG